MDSAYILAKDALSYAKKNNYHEGEVYANVIIATVDFFEEDYVAAINNFVKTEKEIEKIKKNTVYHYLLFTNLACIYSNNLEPEIAINKYKKALHFAKKLQNTDYLIASYNNIAGELTNLKNYDNAKKYYDSSLNLINKNNFCFDNLPSIYLNIAQLYFLQKNYIKAETYYAKALELTEDIVYRNFKIIVLQKLVRFNVELEKFDRAKYYFNMISDSLISVEQYAFKKEILLYDAYRIYKNLGNNERALFYLENSYEIIDSTYLEELDEIVSEYKIKYEVDNITRESEKNKEKLNRQIIYIVILSGSLLIFVALLISLIVLLKQKNSLNQKLKITNDELSERNTEIDNNLKYAANIQSLIMKNFKLNKNYIDYFIIDKAKFKVGGDFSIFKEKNDKLFVVLADCTGHGISAAFLSNLAYFYLLQAIDIYDDISDIMKYINNKFYDDISNNNFLTRDALCLSVLCIDNNTVYINGSKSRIWHYDFSEKKIEEIKLSATEIANTKDSFFESFSVKKQKNDIYFLSSDGFPDQFGENGKLKYHRFRDILQEAADGDFNNAKMFIENKLIAWKGNFEQTDDILTIGIKIL